MTDKKRVPVNTEREVAKNPKSFLFDGMIFGASQAIERQEAQGQESFVESETLPTKMSTQAKTVLEDAGVKFLGQVAGDDLFQYVELPKGWKKVGTDHSMHSKLLDEKGRIRASIFYKAAFYDRDANLSVSRRFTANKDYAREDAESVIVYQVMDCGEVVHTTEPLQSPEDPFERSEVSEKARKAADEWLTKNYPEWEDPGAYWD